MHCGSNMCACIPVALTRGKPIIIRVKAANDTRMRGLPGMLLNLMATPRSKRHTGR